VSVLGGDRNSNSGRGGEGEQFTPSTEDPKHGKEEGAGGFPRCGKKTEGMKVVFNAP